MSDITDRSHKPQLPSQPAQPQQGAKQPWHRPAVTFMDVQATAFGGGSVDDADGSEPSGGPPG